MGTARRPAYGSPSLYRAESCESDKRDVTKGNPKCFGTLLLSCNLIVGKPDSETYAHRKTRCEQERAHYSKVCDDRHKYRPKSRQHEPARRNIHEPGTISGRSDLAVNEHSGRENAQRRNDDQRFVRSSRRNRHRCPPKVYSLRTITMS